MGQSFVLWPCPMSMALSYVPWPCVMSHGSWAMCEACCLCTGGDIWHLLQSRATTDVPNNRVCASAPGSAVPSVGRARASRAICNHARAMEMAGTQHPHSPHRDVFFLRFAMRCSFFLLFYYYIFFSDLAQKHERR